MGRRWPVEGGTECSNCESLSEIQHSNNRGHSKQVLYFKHMP